MTLVLDCLRWWFPWIGWYDSFCTASASILLLNNFSNSPTLLLVCYLHCGNYFKSTILLSTALFDLTFDFWPLQRVVMSRSLVWGKVSLLYFDVNCHINSHRFNYVFIFVSNMWNSILQVKWNFHNWAAERIHIII